MQFLSPFFFASTSVELSERCCVYAPNRVSVSSTFTSAATRCLLVTVDVRGFSSQVCHASLTLEWRVVVTLRGVIFQPWSFRNLCGICCVRHRSFVAACNIISLWFCLIHGCCSLWFLDSHRFPLHGHRRGYHCHQLRVLRCLMMRMGTLGFDVGATTVVAFVGHGVSCTGTTAKRFCRTLQIFALCSLSSLLLSFQTIVRHFRCQGEPRRPRIL